MLHSPSQRAKIALTGLVLAGAGCGSKDHSKDLSSTNLNVEINEPRIEEQQAEAKTPITLPVYTTVKLPEFWEINRESLENIISQVRQDGFASSRIYLIDALLRVQEIAGQRHFSGDIDTIREGLETLCQQIITDVNEITSTSDSQLTELRILKIISRNFFYSDSGFTLLESLGPQIEEQLEKGALPLSYVWQERLGTAFDLALAYLCVTDALTKAGLPLNVKPYLSSDRELILVSNIQGLDVQIDIALGGNLYVDDLVKLNVGSGEWQRFFGSELVRLCDLGDSSGYSRKYAISALEGALELGFLDTSVFRNLALLHGTIPYPEEDTIRESDYQKAIYYLTECERIEPASLHNLAVKAVVVREKIKDETDWSKVNQLFAEIAVEIEVAFGNLTDEELERDSKLLGVLLFTYSDLHSIKYLRLGQETDFQLALSGFERLSQEDPNNHAALIFTAELYFKQHFHTKSENAFNNAVETMHRAIEVLEGKAGRTGNLYAILAAQHSDQGLYRQAFEYFTQAMKNSRGQAQVSTYLLEIEKLVDKMRVSGEIDEEAAGKMKMDALLIWTDVKPRKIGGNWAF